MLTVLVPFLLAAATVGAQQSTFTTTIAFFPTGVADSPGSLEATFPIPCTETCALVLSTYFYCYVFTTTDALGRPIDPNNNSFNMTACNEYLCANDHYGELSGCLNCIVANGNERPFGYYTNSSMTALPTRTGSAPSGIPQIQQNPNGLINIDQANQILKNVTEGCAAGGTTLDGTTITATPTTTGPYHTTWTSGADVRLTVWTGLTQYTDEFSKLLVTATFPSASSTSGTSTSAPVGSGAAVTSSGAARPTIGALTGAKVGVLGGVLGVIVGFL